MYDSKEREKTRNDKHVILSVTNKVISNDKKKNKHNSKRLPLLLKLIK